MNTVLLQTTYFGPIQWYQKILENPGVSQSAKDAARDMLKQAERAKREILSKLQGYNKGC